MNACTHCGCYCRTADTVCPHCGLSTRRSSSRPTRAAAAVLLGLAIGVNGCSMQAKYGVPDTGSQAAYGVPDTSSADADDDGWTIGEGDCDDGDPDVNPDATEIAGDDLDSDCDGDPET